MIKKVVFPDGYPLHSGCADPCDFPKCGKLNSVICGVGDCVHVLPGQKNPPNPQKLISV